MLVMAADGRMLAHTHPMAKVLQSAAGAKAVMGSKMVLAERCSDVEGSNRMMLPWAFPGSKVSTKSGNGDCRGWTLTKSNVSIPHPRCYPYLLIRGKTGYLVAREQVPYYCG